MNNDIDKAIKSFLPNLGSSDKSIMVDSLNNIIVHLQDRFHLDSRLTSQFTQNNYRDIIAILQSVIPYSEQNHNVRSIADFMNDNITNFSYDHDNFNFQSLNQNIDTYKKTIDIVSNKLFVNWINIVPLTLKTYQDSPAWIKSKNFFDKVSIDDMFHGIHFYDIYNALNRFLYLDVNNVKWLLYEMFLVDKSAPATKPILYYNLLDEYFSLDTLENYDDFEDVPEKFNIQKKWQALQQEATYDAKKAHFFKTILFHYAKRNKINTPKDDPKFFIEFSKTVNIGDLYKYLHQSIIEFHKTWYGKSIRYIKPKWGSLTIRNNEYYYGYKNFYNYAKIICRRSGDRTILNAHQLNRDELIDIITKIKTTNLNLGEVIKTTYGNVFDRDLHTINAGINSFIRENLLKVVFECYICHGLYSQFVPNKMLTDYKYVGFDFDDRSVKIQKTLLKTIREYDTAFYYLTNTPFRDIIVYDKNKRVNALEYMLNVSSWYAFYSMDWLFQLNFYNHFLFNRIMFVTGATGQGKSTQIPKLLHYGVRAFDLERNPKIVSTQPRTLPTKENAVFISREMGVPNKQYSKALDTEVNSFTTFIQYKSQNDKSYIDNNPSYIREMTDGLLLEGLLQNNFRDNVLIVDEAHEHNTNMDLILTIARDILKSNPALRLIITSATMDEDEKIYRRFYKSIPDKMQYLDRRIHLAPPFEPSRYTIQDIYLNVDPKDYEEAQKLGIEKAIQACQKVSGDILFFSVGKKDIRQICEELNQKLPKHAIALPFYRELADEWKDIIPNISKNWDKINFDRGDLFRVIEGEEVDRKKHSYSQAIIVSTNIAEASITISSLSCVIDTGYYNYVYYDPKLRTSKLEVIPISEMSRVQRRGRVGRKSDGIVYYMYTKDSRKQASVKYSISSSDFTLSIYKLLGKYDMETIMDNNGTFYIIHPCELDIRRNKDGSVIDIDNSKMRVFQNIGKIYELYNDTARLSQYQKLINYLPLFQNDYENEIYTYSIIRTLYYAHSYKCLNEVMCVISMLRSKNFQKFLKLHPKTQSEIIQLFNLSKKFYKLLKKTTINTIVEKNALEKYTKWKAEFKQKGKHTNLWDKIPIKKEEFNRLHNQTDEVMLPNHDYDDSQLIKYLQSRTKVMTIDTFTQSFIKNLLRLPPKARILREQLGTELLDVKRSDDKDYNIMMSFQKGFPLNVINITGNRAKAINELIDSPVLPFTKEKHNIMAASGDFLYLTYNFDGEPDILSQIIS